MQKKGNFKAVLNSKIKLKTWEKKGKFETGNKKNPKTITK